MEEELKQEANMSPERREALAAFREFPGNRPSNTFLVDRVTPFTLGAMVAMYEHKTFVQVVRCLLYISTLSRESSGT